MAGMGGMVEEGTMPEAGGDPAGALGLLHPRVRKLLVENGITAPTAPQEAGIPHMLRSIQFLS